MDGSFLYKNVSFLDKFKKPRLLVKQEDLGRKPLSGIKINKEDKAIIETIKRKK